MPRLTLAVLLTLSACGFHPRGGLPDTMVGKGVSINGLGGSATFYKLLNARLVAAGGKVVQKNTDAIAVLNILKQRHVRRPIALNAVGRANMFDLNFVVVFEVRDNKGHPLSGIKEIAVKREYFNTQYSPLSQGFEEQTLRQEMESEASTVLLRQMIAILENPRPIKENQSAEEFTKTDDQPEEDDKSTPKGNVEKP